MEQAVESATQVYKSVCRSCHGGCGALLHVREGRLVKIQGDRDSPLNHGHLCPIGGVTVDLVNHPDRLVHPRRRVGPRGSGRWQRISWDDALDEIATRLLRIREEFGPESIALGTGTGRHHIRWVSRFGHALGTPNWCEPGFAQCFHPRVNTCLLTFGDFPVCDYTGGTPPACVLFWGHNPIHSGPDGETRFNVLEALKHKPRTIVVDPRRTALAAKADLWLRLRPGTDDALALAMLSVIIGERLFDERFVRECTHGFEPLAAHIPTLLAAMREGKPYPVKAFLVFGNNTLATYANSRLVHESLMKLDFMVCADLFVTPTAELADIVLPAAAWPELDEIVGLPTVAANVVLAQQKVVQVGECRSDEEIFVALARKMKLPVGTEDVKDVLNAQLKAGGLGYDFDALAKRGFAVAPQQYRRYEQAGFRTPTGRIELYSTRLEKMGYATLPVYEEPPESPLSAPETAKEFPLVLTTGARIPFFFNSEHRQLANLRRAYRDPRVEIHPETAARHGIANGDWMWIETRRGRIRQRAKLSDGIDPRVIAAEHGWWFPEDPGPEYGIWKSNVNVLTDSGPPYDPQMGTYQLRGLLCRVAKADDAARSAS